MSDRSPMTNDPASPYAIEAPVMDAAGYKVAAGLVAPTFGEHVGAVTEEAWESSGGSQFHRWARKNAETDHERAYPESLVELEMKMRAGAEVPEAAAQIYQRLLDHKIDRDVAMDEIQKLRLADRMTKPQWQESEWYRPGIQYTKNMTPNRAEVLAEIWDAKTARDLVLQKSEGGFWRGFVGFGAAMVASLPDPVNLIPLAGPLSKVSRVGAFVAKHPVLGRAALGVVEGAVGNAATEVPYAMELQDIGDQHAWETAAWGIVLGGALGAGLGAAAGGWAVHQMKRNGMASKAFAEAVFAHLEGETPDVGKVLRWIEDDEGNWQAVRAEVDLRPAEAPDDSPSPSMREAMERVTRVGDESLEQEAKAFAEEYGVDIMEMETREEMDAAEIVARGETLAEDLGDGQTLDLGAELAKADEGMAQAQKRADGWGRVADCLIAAGV